MLELCRCPNIYGPDCIFLFNKAFVNSVTNDFYFNYMLFSNLSVHDKIL